MTVYLVGAGPGDPGLLTRRGAELLARADVVVYDRLVDRAVLALAPPTAELIDSGKHPGGPPGDGGGARQAELNRLLVDRGRTGQLVVRLKGGDPFVFGRGGEEAEALQEAGVPWVVVPGVTSAFAAPAAAGVPVTHRGVSTSVTVVTGQVGDQSASGGVDWDSLARAGGTLVVLMGVASRAEIARRLQAAGRPADTPVAVVERGSTPGQRSVRTTLGQLGAVAVANPAVLVIGAVAGLELATGAALPLAGWSVVVTRPKDQAEALAGLLELAGARVLVVPAIETADPLGGPAELLAAATRVQHYDWVAFTSAVAVHRFVPLLRDGRSLGRTRLAAVGSATAAALAEHRLAVDLLPEVATGAGLAAAFEPAPPGGRVLFPRAEGAREDLPAGLVAKGWEVDAVVAYRTVTAPAPRPELAGLLAEADVITFTSPSTVRGYLEMAGPDGAALAVPPVVACLGPVTAAAAREAGLDVAVECATPTNEALVAALAAYRADPATPGGS